jgi:hypothetical protein
MPTRRELNSANRDLFDQGIALVTIIANARVDTVEELALTIINNRRSGSSQSCWRRSNTGRSRPRAKYGIRSLRGCVRT